MTDLTSLAATENRDLMPVLDWLLQAGQRLASLGQIIKELGPRLVAAGLPVARIRVNFRTLHPEIVASAYVWTAESGIRENRVGHGLVNSDAYLGSPIQTMFEELREVHHRLLDTDLSAAHSILQELQNDGYGDYFGIPLHFSDGRRAALMLCSSPGVLFSESDLAKLRLVACVLAPFAELHSMRRIAGSLLDTYLGHRTGQKVLQGMIRRGDSDLIRAALWFSDLRDFTLHTEMLAPALLLEMLNTYFEFVAAAVAARGGEILRFIGDAMLIVFPTDLHGDDARACDAALEAAEDAFAGLATLNHRRRRRAEPEIEFGVGLHIGDVIYGNVGAPSRLDFTVMGTSVNRTARLEQLTKTVGSPLLMSERFAALVSAETRLLGRHPMKGVEGEQSVFGLAEQ